jgi:integrase
MGVKLKQKDGCWWVFICHKGRRKAKKLGTDEAVAKTIAGKIQAKLTLGEFNFRETEEVPTFKTYAPIWLNRTKPLLRKSSAERYEQVLASHIPAALQSKRLNEITRGDIKGLLLALHQKGLGKATLGIVKTIMSGVFDQAMDAELITANPTQGVMKGLKISGKRKIQIEPLTGEEVSLFLANCQKEWYPLFLTAFRTGLRLGELLALEWGDIDFNGKFIRVSKSYRRYRIEATKTGKDRRVDMSDQLHDALQDLLVRRKREAWESGQQEVNPIIFHYKGALLEQVRVRRVFKGILTKAGLREIRIHDTRHTFASLLLTQGASIQYVKDQLGHSSIQMTVDVYGHLIPGANRQEVNRLDDTQPTATPAQVDKRMFIQPTEIPSVITQECQRI